MKDPKVWKPTYGCTFFFIASESLFTKVIRIKQDIWKAEPFQLELSNVGNCFRTREEASEIAERLILATERELLGNSREAQDLDEKSMLDFILEAAAKKNKPFLDGKPLTAGEKTLIREIRSVKIKDVATSDSILIRCEQSKIKASSSYIAFYTNSTPSKDEAIRAALHQIKQEQGASHEAE